MILKKVNLFIIKILFSHKILFILKGQMMKKYPELPTTFDYDESIILLDLKTDERTDLSNQRLKEFFENSCCECLENKKISNDPSKQNPFIKFDNIDIFEKNTKQLDTSIKYTHIMCVNCIENHKIEYNNKKSKEIKTDTIINSNNPKDISEKIKNKKKTNNNIIEIEFLCGICNENHFANYKIDENSRSEKKNCCSGCSIF